MLIATALTIAGLVLLFASADRFVLAASRLSTALGVSPVIVGALVVGLGTSLPEMFVSALAAGRAELDLAVGNVVGSNIANVSLVLGTAALIKPIRGGGATVRREGALTMAAVAGLAAVLADGHFRRSEGLVLAAGMVAASWLLVRWARRDAAARRPSGEQRHAYVVRWEAVVAAATMLLTLLGADLLVRGAGRLATELGLSEAFIGLTLVAIGTSLPELATSIAASRRGQGDIVLGNVVGSNLFNSLVVAATAGLAGPGPVDSAFAIPLIFMVGTAAFTGAVFLTGRDRVSRPEGLLLLAAFAAFLIASR